MQEGVWGKVTAGLAAVLHLTLERGYIEKTLETW
jgi:hypothetical protein